MESVKDTKAILIIDMPKVDSYAEIIVKNNSTHKVLKRYAHIDLKPIPQKKSEMDIIYEPFKNNQYNIGYNDCIDEISGG